MNILVIGSAAVNMPWPGKPHNPPGQTVYLWPPATPARHGKQAWKMSISM